jgi:hypothetical protein
VEQLGASNQGSGKNDRSECRPLVMDEAGHGVQKLHAVPQPSTGFQQTPRQFCLPKNAFSITSVTHW